MRSPPERPVRIVADESATPSASGVESPLTRAELVALVRFLRRAKRRALEQPAENEGGEALAGDAAEPAADRPGCDEEETAADAPTREK